MGQYSHDHTKAWSTAIAGFDGYVFVTPEYKVSRKWLTEIVSVEETSIQVELAFTQALEAEGLLEVVRIAQREPCSRA